MAVRVTETDGGFKQTSSIISTVKCVPAEHLVESLDRQNLIMG